MNWNQQFDDMMKLWTDAQQQIISNWTTLAQTAFQSPSSTVPPAMQSGMDWANMWREITTQGVQKWMDASGTTVQNVGEQMFAGQAAMMRFMEMTLTVWQDILPTIEAGEDWQSALDTQMKKVRDQLLQSATSGANTAHNIGAQWQAYMKQWQGMAGPWASAFSGGMEHWPAAMSGDRSALAEMNNLYWGSYQETFGKLLTAPSLGYTREMDEKVRLAFAAWLDLQQASYAYQVILADTWVKAFEQFMRAVAERTQEGQGIESMRAFLNEWSGIADDIFGEVFRSDEYVKAQAKYINATMAFRVKQRDVTEMMLTVMDLPTRTEIDEAHRRIYELRKEVKALKKEMADMKAPKKRSTSARSKKKS